MRKDVKITSLAVTDEELKDIFEVVDLDGDGSIDREDFVALLNVDVDPRVQHREAYSRYHTTTGQAMHSIIVHASERKSNLMYV